MRDTDTDTELCTVSWCDHRCRWEHEPGEEPAAAAGGDLLTRARYLTGSGHPPFRWHSRLWPSGVCMEQNEFPPDTDPLYVAEHGGLLISTAGQPDRYWTGSDLDQLTRTSTMAAQLADDLAEAAALAAAAAVPG